MSEADVVNNSIVDLVSKSSDVLTGSAKSDT
jgi:hypothetical protein